MGLETDVQAMMQAGVPEQEIGNFIKSYTTKPEQKTGVFQQVYEGMTSRPAFEMAGSAIGGIVGGLGGSAVAPVAGTAGGAIAGAGLGAGAGGQLYDLLKGESGSLMQQAGKAAKDIAVESTLGVIAPKAAQLAVGVVKQGLAPISKSIAKKVTGLGRVIGGQTIDDIKALERVGMKPDASLLDNTAAGRVGQSLRTKLGSSGVMEKTDRFNYGKAAELFEDTAQGFGKSTSKEQAGNALKQVARENKNKFFQEAEKLYDEAYQFLPDEIPVPNLQKFINNKLVEIDATETSKLLNKEAIGLLSTIKNDIANGTVSKDALNSFKKLSKDAFAKSPAVRTDSDRAMIEMRKIYGQDIDEAVKNSPDMNAAANLEKANEWWKKGVGDERAGQPGYLDRWNKILGEEEGAGAFNYATGKTKLGAKRLADIIEANPEAKGEITAQIFRDLGYNPTSGGFSYQKFLTGYNKLAPETKDLLFKDAGQSFDDLRRVSEMAANLEKKANFSNTENLRYFNELFAPVKNAMVAGLAGGAGSGTLSGALMGAGAGGAVMGAGTGINYGMAKLYTNPNFVKWLADTGKQVLISPQSMAGQMSRLALSATRWPQDQAELAQEYIKEMGFDTKIRKDKNGKIKSMEVKE